MDYMKDIVQRHEERFVFEEVFLSRRVMQIRLIPVYANMFPFGLPPLRLILYIKKDPLLRCSGAMEWTAIYMD
jgi:hypothetical protein